MRKSIIAAGSAIALAASAATAFAQAGSSDGTSVNPGAPQSPDNSVGNNQPGAATGTGAGTTGTGTKQNQNTTNTNPGNAPSAGAAGAGSTTSKPQTSDPAPK